MTSGWTRPERARPRRSGAARPPRLGGLALGLLAALVGLSGCAGRPGAATEPSPAGGGGAAAGVTTTELLVQTGHAQPVIQMRVLQRGSTMTLATESADELRLWRSHTGQRDDWALVGRYPNLRRFQPVGPGHALVATTAGTWLLDTQRLQPVLDHSQGLPVSLERRRVWAWGDAPLLSVRGGADGTTVERLFLIRPDGAPQPVALPTPEHQVRSITVDPGRRLVVVYAQERRIGLYRLTEQGALQVEPALPQDATVVRWLGVDGLATHSASAGHQLWQIGAQSVQAQTDALPPLAGELETVTQAGPVLALRPRADRSDTRTEPPTRFLWRSSGPTPRWVPLEGRFGLPPRLAGAEAYAGGRVLAFREHLDADGDGVPAEWLLRAVEGDALVPLPQALPGAPEAPFDVHDGGPPSACCPPRPAPSGAGTSPTPTATSRRWPRWPPSCPRTRWICRRWGAAACRRRSAGAVGPTGPSPSTSSGRPRAGTRRPRTP